MANYVQLPNQNRLSGINTLAYMGVEAFTPPQFCIEKRAPTPRDYKLWQLGSFWLDQLTKNVWMLVGKEHNAATWEWVKAGNITFRTDAGTDCISANSIVNVVGGVNIDTMAIPPNGNFLQIALQDNVDIGGNFRVTSLGAGVAMTDGTGLFQATNGADGQLLIGGGAAPIWTNLTSSDASIVITPGPNTLDIIAVGGGGGGGFAGLIGDDGITATPDLAHKVTVTGGAGLATTAAPGVLTINFDESPLNGDLMIGGGAGQPCAWGHLTSTGGSIAITHPGANTINIESLGGGGGGAIALTSNAATDATVVGGKIKVYGSQTATWVDGHPLLSSTAAGDTLTMNFEYPVVTGDPLLDDGQLLITSGVAQPKWTRLTAGPNITITPNHTGGGFGTITISATGGVGSGVNVFDCISGSAFPKPDAPNLIYIEGDAYKFGYPTGRFNITTTCPGGADQDLIEIILNDTLYFPNTNAGGTTGVINFNLTPFIHNYGTYNSWYGADAGNRTLVTGNATHNTGIGYHALHGLVGTNAKEGKYNTAVGATSMDACTSGSYNTAVGRATLTDLTTGTYNTALGYTALQNATTSSFNTAVGAQALDLLTTGSPNTCIGYASGSKLTTGERNTTVGYQALFTAVGGLNVGDDNVAIGDKALLTSTASNNTAVGSGAMEALTTARYSVAVGKGAMHAVLSPSYSTAIGSYSMGTGAATGDYNTAIGYRTLSSATTAYGNVAVGTTKSYANPLHHAPLQLVTTGFENTAVGSEALGNLLTGSRNTAIGNLAGSAYVAAERNNICLGNTGAVGDIGIMRLGGADITSCYATGIYEEVLGGTNHIVGIDSARKLGKYVGIGSSYFSAYAGHPEVNVTGSNEKFYLGAGNALHLEVNVGGGAYDLGGGHAAQYTFPVTGSYLLTFNMRISGLRAPFVLAPPSPPVRSVDPIVIECTGQNYSYFPNLTYNGYQPYESMSFAVVAKQNAGDTMKWFMQVSYSPGESVGGTWPLTYNITSSTIGYDAYDTTNFRFTQVSATLLSAG